jgi:hypothetical protein
LETWDGDEWDELGEEMSAAAYNVYNDDDCGRCQWQLEVWKMWGTVTAWATLDGEEKWWWTWGFKGKKTNESFHSLSLLRDLRAEPSFNLSYSTAARPVLL